MGNQSAGGYGSLEDQEAKDSGRMSVFVNGSSEHGFLPPVPAEQSLSFLSVLQASEIIHVLQHH